MAVNGWEISCIEWDFYFFVGFTIDYYLPLTVFLIICAHSASGGNWVLSTVLTQTWVEDEVRGRVFSMDMLLLGLSAGISTSVAGYLVEFQNLSLKNGFLSFSILMVSAVWHLHFGDLIITSIHLREYILEVSSKVYLKGQRYPIAMYFQHPLGL